MSAAVVHPENVPADQSTGDAHPGPVGGDPNTEQAIPSATPMERPPARPKLPADQLRTDTHTSGGGGDPNIRSGHRASDVQSTRAAAESTPHPASACASTRADAPGGAPNGDGHGTTDAQGASAVAPLSPDPASAEATPIAAPPGPGTLDPEQARRAATPNAPSPARAPLPPAPAMSESTPIRDAPVLTEPDRPRGPARGDSMPMGCAPDLADPILALAADVLDDLEKVHNANRNRTRLLTTPTDTPDKDGECRGLGFPADHPYVSLITASVDALDAAEKQATKHLERMFRPHPLRPWQQAQRGIGEKQLARLLAVIGDPYWNSTADQPRTVSQLWAYCGYRPGQRRRKNEKSRWSTKAKSRSYLIAEKCMMNLVKPCARPDGQAWAIHVDNDDCQCSPYRLVYDRVREQKAGSLHHEDCNQCGPRGKPALTGSPRSEKHLKTMALRVAAKTILRDLWREAKHLHDQHADL